MTNFEWLQTCNTEQFAEAMLYFRSSDAVYSGMAYTPYYALDNKYYNDGKTAIQASINWLNGEMEADNPCPCQDEGSKE